MKHKIKMGMVGGGPGAFIGNVHRMAARLDGKIELVCGAFSSSLEKSKQISAELFIAPERAYKDYHEMLKKEASLPEEERIDFVSIVTPNHLHFPIAMAALDYGFHVLCDKPMCMSLEEAKKLREKVNEKGLLFCLTHNYTGYPMVKQAKAMVQSGSLGEIRKVVAEYPQGWLSTKIEDSSHKQATWRTNPETAGKSCCTADIGTHAENLAEYITGLKIEEICADLTSFVSGRALDDDSNVLVRFNNGAKGIIYASQMSIGEENDPQIRVYGSKGALEWKHIEPNTLIFKSNDAPKKMLRTGWGGTDSILAAHNTRMPAGHPEGFIEAFANLYRNFAAAIEAVCDGICPDELDLDFPTVEDGILGLSFIETVLKSSASEKKWVKMID